MRDLSGQTFGSYRLEGLLGRGGMGEVYRAQHLRLTGRLAAVKVLPASFAAEPDFLRRFDQEANSAASLDHPNILPVWDYGEQDGMPYLAMPLVPAGSLKELLERRGPLAPTEAERYLAPIADALDYAHSRGILHRDVKPANILLREDGRPQLADFGIAKAIEAGQTQGLTQAGGGIGTPEYMAPEQIDGRAEPRSDLYGLGIALYQMLSGELPYDGATPYEVALKQLSAPLPPIRRVHPELSPAIGAVLQRALAKDPAARYPTGRAFADAFHEAIVRPAAAPALVPSAYDQRTMPLAGVPASASIARAVVPHPRRPAAYAPPPASIPPAPPPLLAPSPTPAARRDASGPLLIAALLIAALIVGIGGLIAYTTLFGTPPPPTATVAVAAPPVDPTLTAVASGNATTVAGINATATTSAAEGATATANAAANAAAAAAQATALAAEQASATARAAGSATAQAAAAATESANATAIANAVNATATANAVNATATASAASAQTATANARASATPVRTPTATAVPPTNTAVPPTAAPTRAPTVAPTAAATRPSAGGWGPTLAPLSGGKRYVDPGKRFSFSVPDSWVQDQSGSGEEAAFAPPDKAANFAVALTQVAASTSLDTYNAAVEQQARSQLTGYTAVRLDKVVIDGHQAYKRVSRGTAQGQNLQVAQLYFLDNGVAQLLTFVTRAENLDRFAATFDGIAGSYTVGP